MAIKKKKGMKLEEKSWTFFEGMTANQKVSDNGHEETCLGIKVWMNNGRFTNAGKIELMDINFLLQQMLFDRGRKKMARSVVNLRK